MIGSLAEPDLPFKLGFIKQANLQAVRMNDKKKLAFQGIVLLYSYNSLVPFQFSFKSLKDQSVQFLLFIGCRFFINKIL
jgi:hypothetical protein